MNRRLNNPPPSQEVTRPFERADAEPLRMRPGGLQADVAMIELHVVSETACPGLRNISSVYIQLWGRVFHYEHYYKTYIWF